MATRTGTSRRGFLSRGLLAGAALGLGAEVMSHRGARAQAAPNARLGIGFIGIGGMGRAHVDRLCADQRFEIVGLCEVDSSRLQSAAEKITAERGHTPFTTTDYHELLDQPGLDAVLIASPDHWHATHAIHAVRAAKHVYVEKPVTHDLEEGRRLVEEVAKSDVVVQVGTHHRASRGIQATAEIVRSGQLGEIRRAWAWKEPRWLNPADETAQRNRANPAQLDWDRWLGPSPDLAFDPNRAHYAWRYFWDQGGGLMTDWGVHQLDIALWALRPKRLLSVEARGTRWAESPMEVPYAQHARFEFDGLSLEWQQGLDMEKDPEGLMQDNGIAFIGSEASLYFTFGRMPVVYPDTFDLQEVADDIKIPVRGSHYDDWLACIADRSLTPLAPVYEAHWTTTVCTLGNIGYRVGGKLDWDTDRERFVDSQQGNYLIGHHARAPYTID
ncbi:MAG TPA: hypothetical protein DCZ72_05125 [Armatimonadetes bacterium]|nr:hypothetical protein [Armatimonadota bacterium]